MKKLSALELARYFIKRAKEENIELTPLKLQKILYYAQGWHLAYEDKPLFDDPIVAWQYGPVVENVYHQLKTYGAGDLAQVYRDELPQELEAEDKSKEVIEAVWAAYKDRKPGELVTMTHQTQPWRDAVKNPANPEIYTDVMRDYFAKLIADAEIQNS